MRQSPSDEYVARIQRRRQERESLNRADARMSHARLTVFIVAVVLVIAAWRTELSLWWLVAPAAVFAWLISRHERIVDARDASVRGIEFYERGLARIEDRWIGAGDPGDRFRDDRHVYANDLDLFGRGSLFELLSQARTRAGEGILAQWLMTPADADEIRLRQDAVSELSPALDFREQLALAGTHVRTVRTDRLVAWAEASPAHGRQRLRTLTRVATVMSVAAIAVMAITSYRSPLVVALLLQAAMLRRMRKTIDEIVSGTEQETDAFVADALTHRVRDLDTTSTLLRHLERQSFTSDRLVRLRARLSTDRASSSVIISRLGRLAGIRDSTANLNLIPAGLFLLGLDPRNAGAYLIEIALVVTAILQLAGPYIAIAVDRWKAQHAGKIAGWLDTIGEFEALSSLACYRYEHPHDPFPVLLSPDRTTSRARFEGTQLGHPLLPSAGMVRNDVKLAGETQLLVVSGSNMSGKSTLLRTVGINAVLALAGAPVRASSLRITPLAVGATLRIQDSLQEGRSRFYAEITRIRALSDIASGPVPLLFLLDELFHGTNSHDRLVGSAGVLRSLLDRGAVGLITTHDLAVTAVARDLAPRAENVHFEDRFKGHELTFDYRLYAGPVTHSNALALMRAVGLDVPNGL